MSLKVIDHLKANFRTIDNMFEINLYEELNRDLEGNHNYSLVFNHSIYLKNLVEGCFLRPLEIDNWKISSPG